jgi:hypothetical protein
MTRRELLIDEARQCWHEARQCELALPYHRHDRAEHAALMAEREDWLRRARAARQAADKERER